MECEAVLLVCEFYLTPEDDGTAFRRKVRKYSPTASHRRTESSATPLSQPQISLNNFN